MSGNMTAENAVKNFTKALIHRPYDATSRAVAVRDAVNQTGKAFGMTGAGSNLPGRIDSVPTGAAAVFPFR